MAIYGALQQVLSAELSPSHGMNEMTKSVLNGLESEQGTNGFLWFWRPAGQERMTPAGKRPGEANPA